MDERKLDSQLRLAVALAKGYVIRRWKGNTTGSLYAMVLPKDEYIENSEIIDKFPEGMELAFSYKIPDWVNNSAWALKLLEEVNASRDWGITIMNCMNGSWYVYISQGLPLIQFVLPGPAWAPGHLLFIHG